MIGAIPAFALTVDADKSKEGAEPGCAAGAATLAAAAARPAGITHGPGLAGDDPVVADTSATRSNAGPAAMVDVAPTVRVPST